jgi:hypothetical protein
MINNHNLRIIILKGHVIPLTPLGVTLVGLQTFNNYCPTSLMLAGLLMILHVAYNTSECFLTTPYCLQHTTSPHSPYLLLTSLHYGM